MGNRLGQAKLVQLLDHDVLERRASDGDTDGHSEGPHKGIHGSSAPRILDAADGLDTDVDAGQQHAHADSEDGKNHSPDGRGSVLVEEH